MAPISDDLYRLLIEGQADVRIMTSVEMGQSKLIASTIVWRAQAEAWHKILL